jgi:hypothetical protein
LLVNFKLLGWIDTDLHTLGEYCDLVSEVTGVAIPENYPVLGKDAFRTATGVHAAAVIKAMRKGDQWLANRVYSGVPAEYFGRSQTIDIGPMSGQSNVVYWLEANGLEPAPALVDAILAPASSQAASSPRETSAALSASGRRTPLALAARDKGQERINHMGMTISEKILAAHAGKDRVEPGEIVMVKVDVNLANELSAALAIDEFLKIKGAERIANPQNAILCRITSPRPRTSPPRNWCSACDSSHSIRALAGSRSAGPASSTACYLSTALSGRGRSSSEAIHTPPPMGHWERSQPVWARPMSRWAGPSARPGFASRRQ